MSFTDISPLWWHACSLQERLESLRASPNGNGSAPAQNRKIAKQRLKRWRSQEPFAKDGIWKKRLAHDRLTHKVFTQLLGEPIQAVRDRSAAIPAWVEQILLAYSPAQSTEVLNEPELEWLDPAEIQFRRQVPLDFLNIIKPLIIQSRRQVRSGAQALIAHRPDLPFEAKSVENLLFKNLTGRLVPYLMRPVVYELQISRLLGRLTGATPTERYQNFLTQLCEPEHAIKFLEEYPVMARLLVTRLKQWKDFSLEFLAHLSADWDTLRVDFCGGEDPGALVELRGGVADYHREGRTVMILKFNSGLQLVYKPKSLSVDRHFQELLIWLNDHGASPVFRTFKVLDRGKYGWVEFVETASCETHEQLSRFYQRQGAYLALLYVLEATDYHFENLVAAGEHPMLIDLESLFHGRPAGKPAVDADAQAGLSMSHTVQRIGLLPWRLESGDGTESLDLSGLSGAGGQQSPDTSLVCENVGTDEMRFIRKHPTFAVTQNLPSLNGEPVNPLDFVDQVESGFNRMYNLLIEYRDGLLAEGGPIAVFARDEVRSIVCATRTYGLLLTESAHPVLLGDALEVDRFLDKLWDGVQDFPYLQKVIHAELEDLQRGDIPFFTTQPASADIWSSNGQLIPGLYEQPGLEMVRKRIQSLNAEDLALQQWHIRASFSAMSKAGMPPSSHHEVMRTSVMADPAELVEAARLIGDRLVDSAWRGRDGDANWIGLSLDGRQQYTVMPLRFDLYSGTPGIALFLAHLGEITIERRYTELAHGALATMQRQTSQEGLEFSALGAFDGWGGVIYTLTHLGLLWKKPDLFQQAESLLDRMAAMVEKDEGLDLISGAAGCILALCRLYRLTGSALALSIARECGDHLVSRARPQEQGMAWDIKIPSQHPLIGLAHGTSGIAWSLLELTSLTGEQRYRSTALAALEYERSHFDVQAGNWPDLRDFNKLGFRKDNEGKVFQNAWCHGAPGIGLCRALALEHIDTPAIRHELDQALAITLKTSLNGNHSLCHGSLGNLDFILTAGDTLGDESLMESASSMASTILADIRASGWKCGLPLGGETSGLMVGLAGIGYGLLRAASPCQTPSIHALDLPGIETKKRSVIHV